MNSTNDKPTNTICGSTGNEDGGGGLRGGGGGSNSNNNVLIIGPCGACKYLRRKCINGCVFAPYFRLEQGAAHFAAVHKVFGASNASKMLLSVPPQKRLDAVVSICYEALARVGDPVHGCVAQIFTLQQQILNLQAEVAYAQARLATIQHECQLPYPPDHDHVADFSSMQHEMQQSLSRSTDMTTTFVDQGEVDDGEEEFESLARELVFKHLSASSSGFTFRPPKSSP